MCFHTAQEKFRSSALNVALNIKAISKPQARASVRLVENGPGSDPNQILWLLKKKLVCAENWWNWSDEQFLIASGSSFYHFLSLVPVADVILRSNNCWYLQTPQGCRRDAIYSCAVILSHGIPPFVPWTSGPCNGTGLEGASGGVYGGCRE